MSIINREMRFAQRKPLVSKGWESSYDAVIAAQYGKISMGLADSATGHRGVSATPVVILHAFVIFFSLFPPPLTLSFLAEHASVTLLVRAYFY